MADRYLLESGAPDGYLLEDGTGVLLLDGDAAPTFTATQGNKSAASGGTTTLSWSADGTPAPTIQVQRLIVTAPVHPTIVSTSNITLSTAASQTPSVTVPAGANACIIGSQYYSATSQTVAFSGSGWMVQQASGGDWDYYYANNAYVAGKITATGSQTLSVSATGTFDEGPTLQIIWLTVENLDDWILDHQFDPPASSPDSLSVTVNSQTNGLVVGVFGNFSTPAVPSGTTQVGSGQTTNGHTTLIYSVDTVGATTTAVNSASYDFPTLFAVSAKAGIGSSVWADETTGTNFTGSSPLTYTTPTLTLGDSGTQRRATATNTAGSVTSAAMTLTVTEGASQSLAFTLLTNSQTFYSPTVVVGSVAVTVPLLTNSQTFYSPTVTVGSVAVTVPLLTNSQTFYSPTVVQEGATEQTLTVPLLTNSQTFYAPTAVAGAVALTFPFVSSTTVIFAPSAAVGAIILSPPLLENSNTLFAPSAAVGAIILSPPLLENSNTLFFPIISGGVAPSVSDSFLQPIIRRRRR